MMHRAVSQSERKYLEDGILQGIRLDGRGYLDYRPYSVETGILSSANGSARIFTADADVIVGVKCEVTKPSDEKPDEGDILFTVDCPPSIGFEIEEKSRGTLGYYLSDLLTELCASRTCIDRKAFSILPHHFCWMVFVDVTIMEWTFHGNNSSIVLKAGGCLSDIISIGIRAALGDTLLPRLQWYEKENTEDASSAEVEYQLEADDRESAGLPFPLDSFPVCVTVGQIKDHFLWDMSSEEESCADTIITTSIDRRGNCSGLHKSGMGTIELSSLTTILQNSQSMGEKIIQKLHETLDELQLYRHDGQPRTGFMKF
ncbi:3' exoribonuclease family, domain 1 domain-containing protein [Cardiosporidium cionae]|uniref:Ribosomal RNA-processing protein 42 n=1 Tax=Cardiosporidium cionae TaxID=476202 RepID=A0ABQ7JBI8_9APIC|nr:3' exoribonuclease family, domain 1 domain-containing protein [Cardiosporidium cionae]|eukprot:KAF8821376.1 3' exoribonuclease family, domain 1 domain-containing protein [Cardiosporidium cionae]